jgi:hypothetical protein
VAKQKSKVCTQCHQLTLIEQFCKSICCIGEYESSCTKCKKIRSAKYYLKNKAKIKKKINKYRIDNAEKLKAASKIWKKNNPEKVKAAYAKWSNKNQDKVKLWNKKWFKDNKEYRQNYSLVKRYNISVNQKRQMLLKQANKCALPDCSHKFKDISDANVDHCHKTKKVRALLCVKCNLALGQYEHLKDRKRIFDSYIGLYG